MGCHAQEQAPLNPRLLLDTHILIRVLADSKKLSREQLRALEGARRRSEPLAFSAISLLEIAVLVSEGKLRLKVPLERFFAEIEVNPVFCVLPMTYQIAIDVAHLSVLRDPTDRAIAATARVHRLKLVTSDERIVDSNLVPVID